jgi:hypothetical protein
MTKIGRDQADIGKDHDYDMIKISMTWIGRDQADISKDHDYDMIKNMVFANICLISPYLCHRGFYHVTIIVFANICPISAYICHRDFLSCHNHAMAKRKTTKGQTMIYITYK